MERRFSQTMASKWQTAFVVGHKIPWRALLTAVKNYNKSLEKLQDFFSKTKTRLRPNAQDQYFHFCPRDQDPGLEDYITAVIHDLSSLSLSMSSPPTNQQPVFFTGRMAFLSPNKQCQITEGNNITFRGLAYSKLTWCLPTLSLTTDSSWLPWGRVAVPLISPLMPVPLFDASTMLNTNTSNFVAFMCTFSNCAISPSLYWFLTECMF